MDIKTRKDFKTQEEFDEYLDDNELNTCDKCGCVESTYDLIWITADDFEPKENEVVPKELYKKYDALCESCYLEEVIIIE